MRYRGAQLNLRRTALLAAACSLALCHSLPVFGQDGPAAAPLGIELASAPSTVLPAGSSLPSGTPVIVFLDQDLDTAVNKIGDSFRIVVAEDVVAEGTIIIPKGAVGNGDITFLTSRGGFGKGGILQIAVRQLELGERRVLLDGRYREEGKNNEGATAATMFAVGIFAGFIKGKTGMIPRGRLLKARIAEAVDFVPGAPPPPVPEPSSSAAQPTDLPAESSQPPQPEVSIPSKENQE